MTPLPLDLFIYLAAAAGVYCLVYASWAYWESGTLYPTGQTGHFIYNRFMHHKLSSAIGMHAIYFSFYCSFAGIALLQKVLFQEHRSKLFWGLNLCLVLFFAGLLFLLKSSLFAFVFPLVCLLLLFLRFKAKLSDRRYLFVFVLISILIGMFSYEGVKSKLGSFKTQFAFDDTQMSPLVMRLALWKSSWELIQQNPFLGVGTGDGQDKLMEEFKRVRFQIGETSNFNVHNMYLQYWMSNGVFATVFFLIFLLMLFNKAIKHRNFLFFAFVLFFSFFSITESTMLKQKGIVFFVFFAFLFITDPNCWKLPSTNIHEDTTSA